MSDVAGLVGLIVLIGIAAIIWCIAFGIALDIWKDFRRDR